jgi:Relaxase/Mobilisation nuclease domain
MIGGITKGSSFRGLFDYLLDPSKDPIILNEARQCEGSSPSELAAEFQQIANLRSTTKLPVVHISLSFAPKDGEIDHSIQAEIANRVITEMGYTNCQYIAIAHGRDDPGHVLTHHHEHLHCAINAIDVMGHRVRDSYDFPRLEKSLRKIEQDFGLKQIKCSWEQKHKIELAECAQLKEQIATSLSERPTLEAWIDRLKEENIKVQIKLSERGKLQGVSFKTKDGTYSGRNAGWGWNKIEDQLTPSNNDAEIFNQNRANYTKMKAQPINIQEQRKFELAIALAQQRLGQSNRFKNGRIEIVKTAEEIAIYRHRPSKTVLTAKLEDEKWKSTHYQIDRSDLHHLLAATSGQRNRSILEKELQRLEEQLQKLEREHKLQNLPNPVITQKTQYSR